MHIIDLLFCSWKTFDVKFGRYLDPFSISIDIRRSQRSRYGSYFAIDSVRLHNCEPGTYQEITKLNFPGICNKLSNINSVIWVFFIDPFLVFIFGLISYPLTIYAYTALWYFSRHNSIYTFFGNKFKSNFLVFFLWLFQAWIVFLEIWKSKKKNFG